MTEHEQWQAEQQRQREGWDLEIKHAEQLAEIDPRDQEELEAFWQRTDEETYDLENAA